MLVMDLSAASRWVVSALWIGWLGYWVVAGFAAGPAAAWVVPALWIGWLAYWVVAGRDVKPTRWREFMASRLRHQAPLALGLVLLLLPRRLPPMLDTRFAPIGTALPFAGILLVAGGLSLAVWARRHLGRNWSSWVTVKDGHALVRTGPYRLVRHPIYSGLLLAFAGTALAIGRWHALLALPCVFLSFVLKSRVEEAQMHRIFPEYLDYRRRSWALIPLLF